MLKYKSRLTFDKCLHKASIAFISVFALEMIITIIAKGLLFHKGAYLRNWWNILDCFSIVSSFIALAYPNLGNLSIIRVIRLLRMFSTFSRFTGIQRIISSVIISIPSLVNALLFMCFIFLIFAILGMQVFSGVVYNRCRYPPILVSSISGVAKYKAPPINEHICKDGKQGTYECPNGSHCVNFYDIPTYFNMNDISIEAFDINDEELQSNSWLYYGEFNFDNIVKCVMNVLGFMTIQNWGDAMTRMFEGCYELSVFIYFYMVVIVGGFFVIKIILAAQNEALNKVNKEELETKLKFLTQTKEATQQLTAFKKEIGELVNKEPIDDNKSNNIKPILRREFIEKKADDIGYQQQTRNVCFDLGNQHKEQFPATKRRNIITHKEETEDDINNLNTLNYCDGGDSNSNTPHSVSPSNYNASSHYLIPQPKLSNSSIHSFTYTRKNLLVIRDPSYTHSNINIKSTLLSMKSKHLDTFLYETLHLPVPSALTETNTNIYSNLKPDLQSRLKFMFLEEHSHTPQFIIFNTFIYFIITINIIFISLISYPMNTKLANTIDIINFICSSVFMVEFIMKIIILKCRQWAKDAFNIIDLIIIVISIFEIIYVKVNKDPTDNCNSSLSALRAIRYIRLLRLFKQGSFIKQFTEFIIASTQDLLFYSLLLLFFIYIFALTGRELFANKILQSDTKDEYNYVYAEPQVPRENFDGILNAFVTVFTLLIGDNWPVIMYDYSKLYKTSAYIYFIIVIMFGNITLLNLFLSILLANYQRNINISTLTKQELTINETIQNIKIKTKTCLLKCLDCCIKQQPSQLDNTSNNVDDAKANVLKYKSLMIFKHNSAFRKQCYGLITNTPAVNYIIYTSICISLIILALDAPNLTNITAKKVLLIIDIVTSFIFLLETILKVISFGLLFNGNDSYLRNKYNIIDLISLVISIIYIAFTSSSTFTDNKVHQERILTQILRVIKLLRLIRIIKLFDLSKPLLATFKAFYISLKQVLKIIAIAFVVILIFTIIGINYFRGRFSRCDFTNVPIEYISTITTKYDCLDYGGDWVTPYPNLNNIKSGFVLFFEMMITTGWTKYMYMAIDANDINYQPQRDKSYRWALFFVLYMFIVYFFIINFAVAILNDNYLKEKVKIENNRFKLPVQNEFMKVVTMLFRNVDVPKKKIRDDVITQHLINILDSIYYDVVITLCIIANLVMLMMNFPNKSEMITVYIDNVITILNYIFIVEAAVKIYVYRMTYFSSGWNIIDFIIVIETLISMLLHSVAKFIQEVFGTSLLLALRVSRILRLLQKFDNLYKVFNSFINAIPAVVSVFILYIILLFIYAVIGVNLFYNLQYQHTVTSRWNFNSFVNAVLLLIRVTTGEEWNAIMHECMKERDGFFYCKYTNEILFNEGNVSCGSIYAIPYFISFIIFSKIMFLDFFSVVIASAMTDASVFDIADIKQGNINAFKHTWVKFDKNCTGFIEMKMLHKFLYSIGHPYGLSSLKVSDYIRMCSMLNIYTYCNRKDIKERYVFFYDVLVEVVKYFLILEKVEEESRKALGMDVDEEELLMYKMNLFYEYITAVDVVQRDKKYMKINPFYKEKFKNEYEVEVVKEKCWKVLGNKKCSVHVRWAVEKIGTFVKCYKCVKKKTQNVIKQGEYKVDMVEYVEKYIERGVSLKNPNVIKEMRIKRKEIHEMSREIIKEEDDTDKMSSSSSRDKL